MYNRQWQYLKPSIKPCNDIFSSATRHILQKLWTPHDQICKSRRCMNIGCNGPATASDVPPALQFKPSQLLSDATSNMGACCLGKHSPARAVISSSLLQSHDGPYTSSVQRTICKNCILAIRLSSWRHASWPYPIMGDRQASSK